MKQFADRRAAGRELASHLGDYCAHEDVLVLGLARGGVPVACEVAEALRAPLDVIVVRKLGAPWQPEFAMGAIASPGIMVLNDEVPGSMFDTPAFAAELRDEIQELHRREALYRSNRPARSVRNHTVVLADDGAATGASMLAAVRSV